MNKEWLLAAYQGSTVVCDKDTNLKTMKEQIKKSSEVGARLIIFPEAYTTGYDLPQAPDDFWTLAETQNGYSFQYISQCAKEFNIAVIYGYFEKVYEENGTVSYYNSAQFINKQGHALTNFRKLHLCAADVPKFKAGRELSVVSYEGINIAILICYDVEFPEIVREATLCGAQLIIVPTACGMTYLEKTTLLAKARAIENHLYVAYINHCGQECNTVYYGSSVIYDPFGNAVASVDDGKQLMLANIDIDMCIEYTPNKYLKDRRPELYGTVCK